MNWYIYFFIDVSAAFTPMKMRKEDIKIWIQSHIVTKAHFSPLSKPSWYSTILGAFEGHRRKTVMEEIDLLWFLMKLFKSHTNMGTCSSYDLCYEILNMMYHEWTSASFKPNIILMIFLSYHMIWISDIKQFNFQTIISLSYISLTGIFQV